MFLLNLLRKSDKEELRSVSRVSRVGGSSYEEAKDY